MIAYMLVFRHQPALLVVSVATITIVSTLRDGIQHPFAAALAGSILAIALIALTASVWYKGYTSKL
jgi:hypothetical protein